ncbi:hypothetical protein IPG36_02775 [bacterium]|nr:MAG: hypothetical protein IPG36_02775 [bacterium]
MKAGSYILYSFIGSFVWSALWVWLGFTLGEHFETVNKWMHDFALVFIGAALLFVAWHMRERLGRVFNKLRRSPSSGS